MIGVSRTNPRLFSHLDYSISFIDSVMFWSQISSLMMAGYQVVGRVLRVPINLCKLEEGIGAKDEWVGHY